MTGRPSSQIDQGSGDSPLSLFLRFLKFGSLAWGGPAAQIQMISKECVDEEGWVDQETFKKTLAVFQVLPGPEAHELCVYFGRIRGGKAGAFMAGLGFMLPGFILMLGLSVLYVEVGLSDKFDGVFEGVQAAVGALVAMAIVRLGRKFIHDVPLFLIAAASMGVTLGFELSFFLALALSGIAYWAWCSRGRLSGSNSISLPSAWLIAGVTAAITLPLTATIFFEGLKAGLLTFGGAYTVVPFLQGVAVDNHHWLTNEEFLDGIALGGILPAPLIIFSTFVGYLAGGMAGALAMTFGIFLPAFVLPIFFHHQLVAIAESPRIRPFLLGVAAGVIGLIAAVTVQILEVGVTNVLTLAIALVAFAMLYRFQAKVTVVAVIFGAGLVGAISHAL